MSCVYYSGEEQTWDNMTANSVNSGWFNMFVQRINWLPYVLLYIMGLSVQPASSFGQQHVLSRVHIQYRVVYTLW